MFPPPTPLKRASEQHRCEAKHNPPCYCHLSSAFAWVPWCRPRFRALFHSSLVACRGSRRRSVARLGGTRKTAADVLALSQAVRGTPALSARGLVRCAAVPLSVSTRGELLLRLAGMGGPVGCAVQAAPFPRGTSPWVPAWPSQRGMWE